MGGRGGGLSLPLTALRGKSFMRICANVAKRIIPRVKRFMQLKLVIGGYAHSGERGMERV